MLLFIALKKYIYSPLQEFSSIEHWKNTPVSTTCYCIRNACSLFGSGLVFELCIHQNHHQVNLGHVCFPFFLWPFQTYHHPLKRQQDGVHVWIIRRPPHPQHVNKQVTKLPPMIFLPPITKLNKNPVILVILRPQVTINKFRLPLALNLSLKLYKTMILFLHFQRDQP